MMKMSKEMSEEAFNEIVDGFEYIRTLTEWGSKNIKQHIQRLQQENKYQKEVIDNIKKCFDDGHFEDGCDCLIIEKYIDSYLKEVSE